MFIKAISDTVFDMINTTYYGKPLICIEAVGSSLSRLFLTLYLTFDMINDTYYDKPLICIEAIGSSLSRLFLTLYLT